MKIWRCLKIKLIIVGTMRTRINPILYRLRLPQISTRGLICQKYKNTSRCFAMFPLFYTAECLFHRSHVARQNFGILSHQSVHFVHFITSFLSKIRVWEMMGDFTWKTQQRSNGMSQESENNLKSNMKLYYKRKLTILMLTNNISKQRKVSLVLIPKPWRNYQT